MNGPFIEIGRVLNGSSPLDHPAFFADVDLLATANEPDYSAPFGDSFRELDEVLGLRFAAHKARDITMLELNLFGVKGPLGFVKDQDMLRRYQSRTGGISFYIILNTSHECLAAAAGTSQLVLKDFDQWAVSG